MKFVPKIVYASTTLSLTVSQKLWEPETDVAGGYDKSAAGIPETFIVRNHEQCTVTLRFSENEWASVNTFIKWAQANPGTAFTFWFDKTDAATQYTCYLDSPQAGSKIKPTRDDFRRNYTIQLVLRSTNGTVFNIPAYN